MRRAESDDRDGLTIAPSLVGNAGTGIACILLAFGLFRARAAVEDVWLLSLFLVLGGVVFLAAHLPGATGLWLDREGFEMREMYKARRFQWQEVGVFTVRRKLIGTAIVFAYTPRAGGTPEEVSLPRGVGYSIAGVARTMNDWRARAVGEA